MSINISSAEECRRAYRDYYFYGNTMKISNQDIGEIERVWADQLPSWRTRVSQDDNQYVIDDEDYSTAKKNGREQGEEATDGKPNTKAGVVQSYGSGATAIASAATAAVALAKKGSVCAPLMWVAAALCAVAPTIYAVNKANKDGKEACDVLQNEMGNAQAALQDTQSEMEDMATQLIELADEAKTVNDEANTVIVGEKTEFDMYRATFEALKAKAESGEPLTEDEKALYEKLAGLMEEAGENITSTQEETSGVVGEIYGDMGTYQDGYDYAAETMGEIEGLTDYAESFDGVVKANCKAAEVSLYANAGASGLVAAKLALDFNLFTKAQSLIMGGVAVLAGTMSTIYAHEQGSFAGQVGKEIDLRKDTQDLNLETTEIYDVEIENYAGAMQGVEDLELDIPNDLEVPETTPLPAPSDGYPSGTPDEIKPKDEEE